MRKTKIICTLGPSTDKDGVLEEQDCSGEYYGRTDSGSEDAESPGSGKSRTFAGTCRTDREER